jgi:hypothetical protein
MIRSRQKSCEGKQGYPSFKIAHEALKDMKGTRNGMQVYRCPYCHDYHIGHAFREVILNKRLENRRRREEGRRCFG